jgi:hypothetical protein
MKIRDSDLRLRFIKHKKEYSQCQRTKRYVGDKRPEQQSRHKNRSDERQQSCVFHCHDVSMNASPPSRNS